jgi:hypothetical protein
MKEKPEPLRGKVKFCVECGDHFKIEDVESACEFYLRYKDDPELLIKEHPEYEEELDDYFETITDDCNNRIYTNWKEDLNTYTFGGSVIDEFNEWLFKLAFKDVIG